MSRALQLTLIAATLTALSMTPHAEMAEAGWHHRWGYHHWHRHYGHHWRHHHWAAYGGWNFGGWGGGYCGGGYCGPVVQPIYAPCVGGVYDGYGYSDAMPGLIGPAEVLLSLEVPPTAEVFVNGLPTQSTGPQRRYVSRNLTPGQSYTYEVQAKWLEAGRPVTQTRLVTLTTGQTADLTFTPHAAVNLGDRTIVPIETTLKLNVPPDARVTLAGASTRTTGPVRYYRSAELPPGEKWNDYKIVAEIDRDGETLTEEVTITLAAGESREVTIDFDSPRLSADLTKSER